MPRTKIRDVRAAAKRGLVDEETEQFVAPKIHKRICYACGDKFRPFGPNDRGFCCPCCGEAWAKAVQADPTTRHPKIGEPVVLYKSGLKAMVVGFQQVEVEELNDHGEPETKQIYKAVVEIEDGRRFLAGWNDIGTILDLPVSHVDKCPKGKNPWAKRRKGNAEGEDDQAGDSDGRRGGEGSAEEREGVGDEIG